MPDNVEHLPRRYRYPKTVSGREHWDQPEPSDEMVWEMCAHTRGGEVDIGRCLHCPAWETHEELSFPAHLAEDMKAMGDPPMSDKIKRGCRAMAECVSRVAHAMISKGKY